MSARTPQRDAIEEMARALLEDCCPEELPFLPFIADMDLTPDGTLAAPGRERAMGAGSEVMTVSSAVICVSHAVFAFLCRETLAATQNEARGKIAAFVHRLFSRDDRAAPPTAPPVALSAAQLVEVRDIVRRECVRSRLSPERSERVSNAVVAALATEHQP